MNTLKQMQCLIIWKHT